MIRFARREEILSLNPFFTSFLLGMQEIHFNPDHEANRWSFPPPDAGAEERREWAAWREQQLLFFEQARDRVELPAADAGTEESLILTSDITDIGIFPVLLGLRCGELMEEMGWNELFFLPLPRGGSWFSSRDDFEPLVASNAAFRSLGIGSGFDGGIIADADSIGDLLSPLFWPIRCDTGYPEYYFSAPSAPFVGSICRYGNLHFDLRTASYAGELRTGAHRSGWSIAGSCHEPFSETGHIEGRRLGSVSS